MAGVISDAFGGTIEALWKSKRLSTAPVDREAAEEGVGMALVHVADQVDSQTARRQRAPRLERRPSRVVAVPTAAASLAPAEPSERFNATRLTDHTILVGYGRVGSIVGDALKKSGQPLLVIEVADISSKLRDDNFEVIAGNAARSDVLKAANLAGARYLLIAISFEAGQIVQQARAASIRLVVR
jgi:hypothetical protein